MDNSTITFMNEEANAPIEGPFDEYQHEDSNESGERGLFDGVISSPELMHAYEIAKLVARTDVPVLITGESGVGKDVLARYIHSKSDRAGKPLIRVNCAALPEELLESELFGHERGAFTGATGQKPGKFELANGGAILLDEIAEMSPRLQAKLLHVLQDGAFSRLGGRQELRVNARVLASTNRRLEEAMTRGEFRADVYFRLNVIRIEIPPLRERKQDIVMLSNYFVQKYRVKYGSSVQQLPPNVLRTFLDYDWPGNVRELENVIKRYLILPTVDFDIAGLRQGRSKQTPAAPKPAPPVEETPRISLPQVRPNALPTEFSSLKEVGLQAAEHAEREVVLMMLEQTNWNRKQAARHLNICYRALLNKIKKWQIQRPPRTAGSSHRSSLHPRLDPRF
jgi:two-component system response regulator AtoC